MKETNPLTASPPVKDLMVCNPIVCSMNNTVREAISMMESYEVGSVVIVDIYTRKPLNIITHKDVISAIYHGMLDSPISELIELLKKYHLYTIHEDKPVIEALKIFEEKGIEHLPVINDEGILVGIITGTDILKGLPRFAFIDPLTGLENRRFLDYLEAKLRLKKKGSAHVMMIDIDNFKVINDTYGHIFGDKVLKKVAETVVKNVRSYDNVIRYGGEEILVVLHRVDKDQALNIAERIREAVKTLTFEDHPEVKVSVSIGITPYKGNLYSSIDMADKAMYEAKRQGKDKVVYVE